MHQQLFGPPRSSKKRAKSVQQAATTLWMNPADTAAFRRKQEQDLAPIIRASGAKVD
jgi:hypothetical protein